jgi:hypothetical protein
MIENERLWDVARRQDGLISRAQVVDAGGSRGALRWALDRRWRCVLPSVISTDTGSLTERQRLVAARL